MDIPTKKVGEKARFVNSEGSECVWVVNLLTPLHVLASLESTPTMKTTWRQVIVPVSISLVDVVFIIIAHGGV